MKTAGQKAAETRLKNQMITRYTATKLSGVKRHINIQFMEQFGANIKDFLPQTPTEKKTRISKSNAKKEFKTMMVELEMPFAIRQRFEEQERRLKTLEGLVRRLSK